MIKNFRYDIQGLRAIAVLAVLVFHINKEWLPGGFVGVDIFFVISGYLITSIILEQKEGNRFSFIDFYIGRVKRIVPAYFVLIFVLMLAVAYLYIPTEINAVGRGFRNALIFNSNNYFPRLDTYFGASASENPLLHTWTLAVEMQFYFFLPILVYVLPQKWAKYVALVIAAILIIYSQYKISTGNKESVYFSLFTRVPEFFLGALIPLFRIKNIQNNILSIIGFLLILIALFFINESSPFPGLLALLPCMGAVFLIVSDNSLINQKILSSKSMVFMGEISYSVYLWHWPVLAFIRYETQNYQLTWPLLVAALLIISWVSLLSYYFIEKPFRKASNKDLAIGGLVSGFIILIVLFSLKELSIYKKNRWYPEYLTTPVPIGLTSHGSGYKDTIRGDVSGKDTILLIGDSHGLVMTYYMDLFCKQNKYALRSITNDSYPPIKGLKVDKNRETQYVRLCMITDSLIKSSNIIVFAKKWRFDIPNFETAFTQFANRLDSTKKLIVVTDFPELNADPIRKSKGVTSDSECTYAAEITDIPLFIKKLKTVRTANITCDIPIYVNDSVTYYDRRHLNINGIKYYERITAGKMIKVIGQNHIKCKH